MQTESLSNVLLTSIQKNTLKDDIAEAVKLNDNMIQSKKTFTVWLSLSSFTAVLAMLTIFLYTKGVFATSLPTLELNHLYIGLGILTFMMFLFSINKFIQKGNAIKSFQAYKPKKNITKVSTGTMKLKTYRGNNGTYIHDDSGYTNNIDLDFYSDSNIKKLEDVLVQFKTVTDKIPAIMSHESKKSRMLDQGQKQDTFSNESKTSQVIEDAIDKMNNLDLKRESFNFLSLDEDEVLSLQGSTSKKDELYTFETLQSKEQPRDMSSAIKQIEGDLFHDNKGPHQYMQSFSQEISSSLNTIALKRNKSFENIVTPINNELERFTLITSYNCYCPSCNSDIIDNLSDANYKAQGNYPNPSSASKLNPLSDGKTWECPLCSKQTEQPFAIHKMLDSLIFPTMDRLLQENNNERTKLYLNAESKKRDVLSDERKEIRDLLENSEQKTATIKARIRDMVADVATSNGTLKLLSAELGSFELLNRHRLNEISEEMQNISTKIEAHRDKTLSSFNSAIDSIKADADKDFSNLVAVARREEEARMQILKDQANAMHEMKNSVDNQTKAQQVSATEHLNAMQEQTRQVSEDADKARYNQRQSMDYNKAEKDIFDNVKMK